MANTKSAIKAARKATRLTTRNKSTKTRLKTLHKKLLTAEKAGKLVSLFQDNHLVLVHWPSATKVEPKDFLGSASGCVKPDPFWLLPWYTLTDR